MFIAFSVSKRRPGCVIIQSGYGGTVPSETFQDLFPSETWLVGPGDDMELYPVTEEQLLKLSVMAKNAVGMDVKDSYP